MQRSEIEDILAMSMIGFGKTEWALFDVFAIKKDRTLRFCVNYRCLNAIFSCDSCLLPRMDKSIHSLGDAQVFSTLIANSVYWQIEVNPSDRERTVSTSYLGLYRFTGMRYR